MLNQSIRVMALLTALVVLRPSVAQSIGEEPGTATQAKADAAAVTEVAQEFGPLHQQFVLLHDSLRNKGEILPEDEPAIRQLHGRILAFRQKWPDYTHSLAVDYQLSRWLKDDERADELKMRLIELLPENVSLRVSWAEDLRQQNRYAEAAACVEAAGYDLPKTPRAALVLARCYFAQDRYQEALDLLQSVEEDEIPENRLAHNQIRSLTKTVQDCLELWSKEKELRAAEAHADDLPRVELTTDRGRIVLELFENEAPNTVANFISLVEDGFYDQCAFHRVIPSFMAQTGDPNSKPDGNKARIGSGGPGYYIPDETELDNARSHFTGTLSMANHGPNTGGSQFFMTHEPTPHLNGRHTVFGRVIEGLDVVRGIEKDDLLQTARVLRKRDHEYEPSTLPDPMSSVLVPPRVVDPPSDSTENEGSSEGESESEAGDEG